MKGWCLCDMLGYIEYLNMPTKIGLVLVGIFLVVQIIGELLEFKGKVVPECLKVRKYFMRKKKEKETLRQLPETLNNVQKLLNDVGSHYNSDNIAMRDKWIENVNHKLEENDRWVKKLNEKIDKNNADTLSLLIDSKRNSIINFASHVIDENSPVTRERFNRIFKLYNEYENIITNNGLVNGEVDIAYRIIKESYENHMKNHTFIEDIRGYENHV